MDYTKVVAGRSAAIYEERRSERAASDSTVREIKCSELQTMDFASIYTETECEA